MKGKFILKSLFGLLGSAMVLWSQNTQVTAVRAGKLFDPKSGQMLANQVVLLLGERAGGEAYAPDEVEALSQLANGVGSALEALSLTTDGAALAANPAVDKA